MRTNISSSIIIAIIATLMVVISLLCFIPGFDYKLVYIPSSSCYKDTLICNIDSVSTLSTSLDSIIEQKCNKLSEVEMLSRLERNGLIVSPNDYTARISSYYSVLVAFLVGLFVLFTIMSYFSIKSSFSKEFEEERNRLLEEKQAYKGELSASVNESLKKLLIDSREVQRTIVESLRGKVVDEVIQCIDEKANTPEGEENISDAIKELSDTINNLKEDVNTLFITMVELQNEIATNSNIE